MKLSSQTFGSQQMPSTVFIFLLLTMASGDSINLNSMDYGMRLGSFKDRLTLVENALKHHNNNNKNPTFHLHQQSISVASDTCQVSCNENCESGCDDSCFFWSCDDSCDEDCNEGCEPEDINDCGDAEGEQTWYKDVEDNGYDIEQSIESVSQVSVTAYDCYDELNLFEGSLFSNNYFNKHNKLHPHILRKNNIKSQLEKEGLSYSDYRLKRLQKLSDKSLKKYFNINNFNELEQLFNDQGDNVKLHGDSVSCSKYYTEVYNGLESSFDILSNALNEVYDTGLTLGVGWDISLVFYTWDEGLGIAIGFDNKIGVYFTSAEGAVLIDIGTSFYGAIGFSWDYDGIEGNSWELSVSGGISALDLTVSLGFAKNTWDWEGVTLAFGFSSSLIDIFPISLSFTDCETTLIDISTDIYQLESNISGLIGSEEGNNTTLGRFLWFGVILFVLGLVWFITRLCTTNKGSDSCYFSWCNLTSEHYQYEQLNDKIESV